MRPVARVADRSRSKPVVGHFFCVVQACAERIQSDETGEAHCTGQYFDYYACIDKCVRTSQRLHRETALATRILGASKCVPFHVDLERKSDPVHAEAVAALVPEVRTERKGDRCGVLQVAPVLFTKLA